MNIRFFFLKQQYVNNLFLMKCLNIAFWNSVQSPIDTFVKYIGRATYQDVEVWEVNVKKLSWILNKPVKQTIWEVFISQKFQESVSEYVHQYLLAFLTHTFIHLQKCIPSEWVFLLSNFKEKETRNVEFNFKNGFRKHNFLFKQVVVRGATEIMPIFWLGSRNKMYLWPLKWYDWLNFG